MNCTAHTKDHFQRDVRCARPIGHPGLHRFFTVGPSVQEFPDSRAWFPWFRVTSREYEDMHPELLPIRKAPKASPSGQEVEVRVESTHTDEDADYE